MTWLKRLYQGWLKFAHFIGKINTTILLTIFYFIFLGPAKLITLFLGKDLLDSKWKDRPTYWRKREDFKNDKGAFLKPY